MSLVMIIPSRSRAHAARQAAASAIIHRSSLDTRVLVVVDGDADPEYDRCTNGFDGVEVLRYTQWRGMVGTLNLALGTVGRWTTHVGFMGDDHRVQTPGWDTELMKSAGPWGVAYGDDLNMGERLPTAVVMATNITRALGYMAPPDLGHLYVDNFWRDLGERLGALAYRDDIVIEHMHPTVGKSEWDAQYRRVNSSARYMEDEAAWSEFRDLGGLDAAVARVKTMRGDV